MDNNASILLRSLFDYYTLFNEHNDIRICHFTVKTRHISFHFILSHVPFEFMVVRTLSMLFVNRAWFSLSFSMNTSLTTAIGNVLNSFQRLLFRHLNYMLSIVLCCLDRVESISDIIYRLKYIRNDML